MSRRGARLALVTLLVCGAIHSVGTIPATASDSARTGRRQAAASPDTQAGSISGSVTSAADGRPLARARVLLRSSTNTESRVLLTGADGAFDFQRVQPGAYSIAVIRTGYAGEPYGAERGSPAAAVTVAAGQRLTGVSIPLPRAGVIAGTVLDEDGQPLAGAIVEALVRRTETNRQTLVSIARGETDDHGDFRLIGLAPGRYYVAAVDAAFAQVVDSNGPSRYPRTYYPGVAVQDRATPVDVPPAVEPTVKTTFKLQIVHPVRVSGVLRTQDRRQLLGATMVMTAADGDGLGSWTARDVRILPSGAFAFGNVPPGRYLIRGRGEIEPQGLSMFAAFGVTVEGRDVDNIDMVLQPGSAVDGSVITEAVVPKPALVGLRVRAPFLDGATFGDALTGDVRSDGSFRIRGVMSGTHLVSVEGLRSPWVVKSVVYRGQDITDLGFDAISGQQVNDVRITITDVANDIQGAVKDAAGAPVANALVVVAPVAQQFWTRPSRHIGVTRTDAGGRYQIRGLPAGEYHARAWTDLDEADAYRRDVLTRVDEDGSPISLSARDMRVVDLVIASGATLKRSSR